MPGLLQTGDYARALIREMGTTPADEIEDRVAARLGRQSLFGRSGVSPGQGTNQPIVRNIRERCRICAPYRIYDLEDWPGIGIGIEFDKSVQYFCDRVIRFEG